jgi:hypothetical protein
MGILMLNLGRWTLWFHRILRIIRNYGVLVTGLVYVIYKAYFTEPLVKGGRSINDLR